MLTELNRRTRIFSTHQLKMHLFKCRKLLLQLIQYFIGDRFIFKDSKARRAPGTLSGADNALRIDIT